MKPRKPRKPREFKAWSFWIEPDKVECRIDWMPAVSNGPFNLKEARRLHAWLTKYLKWVDGE